MNGDVDRSRFRHGGSKPEVVATQPPAMYQKNTRKITLNLKLPKLPAKRTFLKILVWLLIIGVAVAIWKWPAKNTIPSSVRSQLHFTAFYPTKNYDIASFSYQSSRKLLNFNTTQDGVRVVVTEEALPPNVGNASSDPSVLLNQLGVRYYTQTQSKYGVVTVAKFWTSSYEPGGQTAILGARGALVLAHPKKDLSLAQWTQYFNNLGL